MADLLAAFPAMFFRQNWPTGLRGLFTSWVRFGISTLIPAAIWPSRAVCYHRPSCKSKGNRGDLHTRCWPNRPTLEIFGQTLLRRYLLDPQRAVCGRRSACQFGGGGTSAYALVEVLLDTGFNGELALTSSVIRRFNLVRGIPRFAELATGDTTLLPSFTATILWDDQPRFVSVIEADSEPLLGMELLLGNRVTLDVRDGGPVTIDALP